jgi:ATP-dependent protease ClpP protease subunit
MGAETARDYGLIDAILEHREDGKEAPSAG